MRTSIKAALVAFTALGALAATGASAQPYGIIGRLSANWLSAAAPGYDNRYYGNAYDEGVWQSLWRSLGDDGQYADGYGPSCDPYYGCPDNYYDDPYYRRRAVL